MLLANERKRHTRKSAVKSIANGYIRSGDLYGKHGLDDLKKRRNRLVHNTLSSDKEKLARDWVTIGREIETAMNDFEKGNR